MTDHTTTIDTHLAGYCEPDATRRLELLTGVWATDGELLDPPLEGTGPEAIAGLVDAVLAHYPAHRFERTTGVDEHHERARYGWALVGPDGTAAVTGLDVAEFDGDGRLRRIVGFFGDLPARDA
jgi:hypothetical protein